MTSAFDTVEILAEFSKAIRHGLIALESLRDVDGVDPAQVTALMDSLRCVHLEATEFLAAVISASAASTRFGCAPPSRSAHP